MFEGKEQEAIDLLMSMLEDCGWTQDEIIDYIEARI